MIWKAIGHSATGISHAAMVKGCEDAIHYKVIQIGDDGDVLLCCASDGAGSARYAARASEFTTSKMIDRLSDLVSNNDVVDEAMIYTIVEEIYDGLKNEAQDKQVELNEFSCTLLGCCISKERAVFFQVGDGAIVRNDGLDFYTTIWWPHNGEYQNSTSFLVDDPSFKDLHVIVLEESVSEVALFTDGLQMLALNMEDSSVHQPFFNDLFRVVRMAGNEDEIRILNRKLSDFLNSDQINSRTDDDKTLFMASRRSS